MTRGIFWNAYILKIQRSIINKQVFLGLVKGVKLALKVVGILYKNMLIDSISFWGFLSVYWEFTCEKH